MDYQNKKEEDLENITDKTPSPERPFSAQEQPGGFEQGGENKTEHREVPKYEKNVTDEIDREIKLMELDEKMKEEAEKKAGKIEFLGEKEKIERLIEIAREKGIVFATNVARKMNDPYLLDIFHDVMAKEGLYKKIINDDDDNDDKNKK